jgi:hypothetical protein
VEVARVVVACVLGRSPSVRVDDALLPVAEVERARDPRVAARALDPASARAAAAAARAGQAVLGCVESGAAASGLVGFLGQSANAASLAPAAGGAPLGIPASPARTSTCRSRRRGSRRPPRAGEPGLGLPADCRRAARPRNRCLSEFGPFDPDPASAATRARTRRAELAACSYASKRRRCSPATS